MEKRLSFTSDYMEGAHPLILKRLEETNLFQSAGYGLDEISEVAREKIRAACGAPGAEVHFLSGGTQTNAILIGALLKPYQGVIAADTGHISGHEAGAIEAGGHKVLPVDGHDGKLSAESVERCAARYWDDANCAHMVMPGLVYLSQPTEYGTLYSLEELQAISDVCRARQMSLYVDGARLAYALACPGNDVTLKDLSRLCDAFYIGGTKCGTLYGEALVIPKSGLIPHLFTMIKQKGALLAKGRIVGLQFDTLFTDGLYFEIGQNAIRTADRIRQALSAKGYRFAIQSPTNQIFIVLEKAQAAKLAEKIDMSFWENLDDGHVVMRICTSWATSDESTDALIEVL